MNPVILLYIYISRCAILVLSLSILWLYYDRKQQIKKLKEQNSSLRNDLFFMRRTNQDIRRELISQSFENPLLKNRR